MRTTETFGEGPFNLLNQNHLEQHIIVGCLSNIEQGHGTRRNENLNMIVNASVLTHARFLEPVLAFSFLTILFYV